MKELDSLKPEEDAKLKGYIESLKEKKCTLEQQGQDIRDKKSALEEAQKNLGNEADVDYLERVQAYNKLVDEYNELIDKYRSDISAYNQVVRDYNARKDQLLSETTGSKDWGNLDESLAFKQFYESNKLDHMDVKFDASNTTDSTDKSGNYTVSGVYKDSAKTGGYSISYKTGDKNGSYTLKKNGYEFTRTDDNTGKNLGIDWNDSTIEFYIELEDKTTKKTTGFTVKLDASTVYPDGTYYGGDKAYSLAQYKYKDADGNEQYLKAYGADGKELSHDAVEKILKEAQENKKAPKINFDISGQSIYAVSAMTCDRFFWEAQDAEFYNAIHNIGKNTKHDRLHSDRKNLMAPNGLDLVLNLDTLIGIVQRDNLTSLKYLEYMEKLAPTVPQLEELQTIGKLDDYETVEETTAETLSQLDSVTELEDYRKTAEAKLNEVLQQMKQLQQELDIPEVPDEPAPTPVPVPVTPETPQETPDAPLSPADMSETPVADTPVTPETAQNPVEDARHQSNQSQGMESTEVMLPQTGVNHVGVLGLALAGFSFLTAGLGLEISAKHGKHSKH